MQDLKMQLKTEYQAYDDRRWGNPYRDIISVRYLEIYLHFSFFLKRESFDCLCSFPISSKVSTNTFRERERSKQEAFQVNMQHIGLWTDLKILETLNWGLELILVGNLKQVFAGNYLIIWLFSLIFRLCSVQCLNQACE